MNEEHKKVSIIIPVHNACQYIGACLESVINQHILCEIIVVDDGSTDCSLSIIKSFQTKYNFIQVIEQTNQGPSVARNKGLAIAKGEYVVLLDGDDALVSHSLQRMYKKAQKTGADIVVGQMNYITATSTINMGLKTPHRIKYTLMEGQKYLETLLKYGLYTATGTNFFYRNGWLKKQNLTFKEHVFYEDELWTAEILSQCKKLYVSSIAYYNYYKRLGSITQSEINPQKIQSLRIICHELSEKSGLNKENVLTSTEWWMIVNLARICTIALHRIGKENDKAFFQDILFRIGNRQSSFPQEVCPVLNRYISVIKKKYE